MQAKPVIQVHMAQVEVTQQLALAELVERLKLVRYSLGMVVLAAELDLEPENLVKVELCLMFRLVIIFT